MKLILVPLLVVPCQAAELRPLSTDRPDTTESPYTVDSGHFQFEMEIGNVTHDGSERGLSIGELNLKYGLDACNELQLVLPFYENIEDGGEGFGNLQVRLKHNIHGNDSGDTALAIMPFVEIPTGNGELGNPDFGGGVIVPYAWAGPGDWSFGVQAEADLEIDNEGDSHALFLTSATTSHPITDSTGLFLELVSILSTQGSSEWEAYFNMGVTWEMIPMGQLDGGIRAGLTDASVDFMPFVGVSTKF
jgi:hypothetical protein